jgi:hypothetical protein
MDFITDNYKWIFSGIGVVILVFVFKYLWHLIFKKKSNNGNNYYPKIKNVINVNSDTKTRKKKVSKFSIIKDDVRILFVDDEHTKFKMVSILKTNGWKNTMSIKDVTDLDDLKVKEANFIFVDINGVGKTLFKDEGLGLAAALKNKYPKKVIIIYSDESTGDRFHRALQVVDDCLPKNAEPYQFINLIENHLS